MIKKILLIGIGLFLTIFLVGCSLEHLKADGDVITIEVNKSEKKENDTNNENDYEISFGQEEKIYDEQGFIKNAERIQADGREIATDRVIVQLTEGVETKLVDELAKKYDGKINGRNPELRRYTIRFKKDGEDFWKEIKETLLKEDIVENVLDVEYLITVPQ